MLPWEEPHEGFGHPRSSSGGGWGGHWLLFWGHFRQKSAQVLQESELQGPSVELLGRSQGLNWSGLVRLGLWELCVSFLLTEPCPWTLPRGVWLPLGAEESPGMAFWGFSPQEWLLWGLGEGDFWDFPPRNSKDSSVLPAGGSQSCTPTSPPAPPARAGSHSRLLWLKGYCQCPPVGGF